MSLPLWSWPSGPAVVSQAVQPRARCTGGGVGTSAGGRVVPWCCACRVDSACLSWVLRDSQCGFASARADSSPARLNLRPVGFGAAAAPQLIDLTRTAVLCTVPISSSSPRSRQILLRRHWLHSCDGTPLSLGAMDESAAFALTARRSTETLTSSVSHGRSAAVGVIEPWTVCAVSNLASEVAPAAGQNNSLEERAVWGKR